MSPNLGAGVAGTGTATPAAAAWADRYREFSMLPHAFCESGADAKRSTQRQSGSEEKVPRDAQ